MTKEEITELAREAGMSEYNEIIGWCGQPVVLERFANLVAAKERDRCAMVCAQLADRVSDMDQDKSAIECCAETIRSLK